MDPALGALTLIPRSPAIFMKPFARDDAVPSIFSNTSELSCLKVASPAAKLRGKAL